MQYVLQPVYAMNRKPSPQQEKILNAHGKFIVNACAGSGKTLTLSKKLVQLIENNAEPHSGIATLSFTNTAWKEIKKNFDEWGLEIKYPNFLGTFDRFINKYIFYKYYYLLDEFDKRPTLVGDLGTPWRRKQHMYDYQQYFDIFSFNSKNRVIKTKKINTFFKFKEDPTDGHYQNIEKMKNDIYPEGFVTQADINYFSLKLIKKFDFISENIANKFPIFLIDEAQDTNDIKMEIMNIILNKENIKEFLFIGDFNQAIYEWNGANPELFEKLSEKYDKINLTENWRSSQNICNFSSKLSKIECLAVNNEVKDYSFVPKINEFKEPKHNKSEFFNNIISDFLNLCEKKGITENIAVLCKGNTLIKTINGQNDFDYKELFEDNKNITYDLIHSRYLFDNKKFEESYLKLEQILSYLSLHKKHISYNQRKEFVSTIGFFNMRKTCFDLINIMPPTQNITVREWIKKFKIRLKKSDFKMKGKILSEIKINLEDNELLIHELFNIDQHSKKFTLSTIHGVKGETFDATLLILKTRTDNGSYKGIIEEFKEKNKMKEDLRNVYVGITRPKKILVMEVPKIHVKMWYELFFDEPYRGKNQSSLLDF